MSRWRRRTAALGWTCVEQARDLVDVDPGVPDLEEAHRGIVGHLRSVAADDRVHCGAGITIPELLVARGNGEAGRQPLDVPVERGRQRLIEVVDVEDQTPVWRREHAEVQQVRITAGLYPDVRRGRVREIPGHGRRRAAEIGERRGDHPAVPDRHQVRHPGPGLIFENRDRVRSVGRRLALRVARARRDAALLTSAAPPFVGSINSCGGASTPGDILVISLTLR